MYVDEANYGKHLNAYKFVNIYAVYGRDGFYQAFAKIGTLRTILPKSVKILPLTATATKDTAECIMYGLSMRNPTIIGISIDHSNNKYIVFPWVIHQKY